MRYKISQISKMLGRTPQRIRAIIVRDMKKPEEYRRFPSAKRCECGSAWIIDEGDLENLTEEDT